MTATKQALVKVWNNLESDFVKGKLVNDERDVRACVRVGAVWLVSVLDGRGCSSSSGLWFFWGVVALSSPPCSQRLNTQTQTQTHTADFPPF